MNPETLILMLILSFTGFAVGVATVEQATFKNCSTDGAAKFVTAPNIKCEVIPK